MDELSISQIHQLFKTNQLTAEKLVNYFLERINELDRKVNAIIELNPDAVEIAKEIDKRIRKGEPFRLLEGIPIVVKDNIDTADKMVTSAGSLALKNHHPQKDAFIVKKLRQAGAIILGKANLSEWANFRGKKSISGWSSRGGQTRNPYALDRTPCGSSSGSAVAVSSDFCTVAIGTETDGSILCPSHINGVVGIKPTMGLVSRSGIIPISHTQDIAGPISRTVKDAAIALESIAGYDETDPITERCRDKEIDFSNFHLVDVEEVKVGIPKQFHEVPPKVKTIVENTIRKMEEIGWKLIDSIEIKIPEDGLHELDVLLTDYKIDLNKYLKSVDPKIGINSIEDLIEFNRKHADKVMPYFGQEWLELSLETEGFKSEIYQKAMKSYQLLRDNVENVFSQNKLDAIFLPTGSPAWLIDIVNGDCSSGSATFLSATTGFPAITIPIGLVQGLPVGGTFMGLPFSEKKLLAIANKMEHTLKMRHSPTFKDTVE